MLVEELGQLVFFEVTSGIRRGSIGIACSTLSPVLPGWILY